MAKMGTYVSMKDTEEVMKMTITYVDRTNFAFVAYEKDDQNGDIKTVLPMKEYYKKSDEEIKKICSSGQVNYMLGRTISVKVSDVNQIRNVVTLSYCDKKSDIKDSISNELARSEYREVDAKVMFVAGSKQSSYAVLATPDNVRLLLLCKDWSYDYIDDMHDVVKTGDTVRVAIMKKYGEHENETRHNIDFVASRRKLLPNPWQGLSERFHKGDTTICRMVKKWNGGFACRIEGVSGIIAFCEIPKEAERKALRLIIGEKYVCGIVNVNEERRSFRVHPFVHVTNE